jgi:hypothetical protein
MGPVRTFKVAADRSEGTVAIGNDAGGVAMFGRFLWWLIAGVPDKRS